MRTMRIVSIGGGPAGLYTSILMKKAFPQADIQVYEQNKSDEHDFKHGLSSPIEKLMHDRGIDEEEAQAVIDKNKAGAPQEGKPDAGRIGLAATRRSRRDGGDPGKGRPGDRGNPRDDEGDEQPDDR